MSGRTGTSRLPVAAEWAGRITFALMGVGLLGRTLRGGDAVFGLLWAPPPDGFDCSETTAALVSTAGAWALAFAGMALVWPRTRLPLLAISLWTTVTMVATWWREPKWPELVPGEQSARWLGPLALASWLPSSRWTRALPCRPGPAETLLRLAAAATFACHGLKALWLDGHFLDYLFAAAARIHGAGLSQAAAESLLRAIGIVDLGVAALLLVTRIPAIAGWMAFWGGLTALARIVHGGLGNWPETLLRAPNAGVPLMLMLAWVAARRTTGDDVSRS